MKIKLLSIEDTNLFIAKVNLLLKYPNYENGTLTYTDIPEPTEVKDENGDVIDSYYELEVSSEMMEQMMLIATEKLVEDTSTTDFEPEKRFEVKGKDEDYLKLLEAYPELGMYRKQTNLVIHKEKGFQIFYTDAFLAGHREILEKYLGVESITDRQPIIENGNTNVN